MTNTPAPNVFSEPQKPTSPAPTPQQDQGPPKPGNDKPGEQK
ncbi:MAG TPA: hypothetical protein VFB23_04930 [Candidatus Acidoferrales bacterium]|nr:hypothetical protein [Candidatus Acidoferrales bacterium]